MISLNKFEIKPHVIMLNNTNYDEVEERVCNEIAKYNIVKIGRKNISTCPVCFDTETTTVTKKEKINDEEIETAYAFMYIYQLEIGDLCIIARQKKLIMGIFKAMHYECVDLDTQIIVGIANLKYEWSFMCKDFMELEIETNVDIFLEMFAPLSANIGQLKIIDIIKIANASLAKIGKDYCTTQKLKGDLDYKKIRNSQTSLTKQELAYCINDVVVGAEYLMALHDRYTKNGQKMPLTATAIVRNLMKDEAYKGAKFIDPETNKYVSKLVYKDVLEKVKNGFPSTYEEYHDLMEKLFRGGYTHGNAYYVGETLVNVEHVDYTSHYPACMVQYKYPTELTNKQLIFQNKLLIVKNFESEKKINRLLEFQDELAFYFKATFKKIRNKYDHSGESINKIISYSEDNCTIDNGRMLKCDTMTVYLTEQDFMNYKSLYTWKELIVEDLHVGIKESLPWYVIYALIESYCDKKALKDAGQPYSVEKSILNSVYGCTVQRLIIGACRDIYTKEGVKHIESPVPFKYLNEETEQNKKYFDYIFETCKRKYNYGKNGTEENLKTAIRNIYSDLYNGENTNYRSEKLNNVKDIIISKLQQRAYKSEINGTFGQSKMLSLWWGIWVTAYARRKLIKMIETLEEYAIEHGLEPIVVYCDTDSLFINGHQTEESWQDIKSIIDNYNNETEEWNKNNLRIYNEQGLLDDIGQFTWEASCTHFKQLGAKRYVQRFFDSKSKEYVIESTIAGLSKEDFSKKINEIEGSVEEKFEFFTDGMIFNEFECSKLTPTYITTPYSLEVTDDEGHSEIMYENCGQVLKSNTFEMIVCGLLKEKLKERVG